eukprot:gene25247-biopygen5745
MDYSIGDRVEVLLDRKLHTAEVRAVYNSGKVDVVYDADNSVGYMLSEAEHGLNKMWMPKKKGKGGGGKDAKVCSVDGCSNNLFARGLCTTHYRKPCSVEGCTTKAMARGLCTKHGAYGRCVKMGCVTNALKRGGHCFAHKKKVACAHPNCSTPLIAGKGVCAKHGAFGICTAWGCKTNARAGKKGHCFKHSKEKATCSASGCSNVVVARGLCVKHGAQGFCSTAGCNTGAVKDGLCKKHGAKKICTFDDCTDRAMDYSIGDRVEVLLDRKLHTAEVRAVYNSGKVDVVYDADNSVGYLLSEAEHGLNKMWMPKKKGKGGGEGKNAKVCSVGGCSNTVYSRGLCKHHGLKPCSVEGCTTKALARGLCSKHGGTGKCVTMGCVTNAQKRGGHCGKHSKKAACAHPNCSTPLIVGKGVCTKHGAFGICTAWGCKTNACAGKKGHCKKHSKDKATCSASDCSNGVAARGLCRTHGARGFYKCSTSDCSNAVVAHTRPFRNLF